VSLSFVGHHPALRVEKGNTRSKRDFRYLDIDLRAFSKDKPLWLAIYVLFLNISAGCWIIFRRAGKPAQINIVISRSRFAKPWWPNF